jgi:2-oxo-3-hexenedioate decarboxylase
MSRLTSLAASLADAAAAREVVVPPARRGIDLAVGDAYLVQDEVVDRRVAAGAAPVGLKLGLTSRAKQQEMGVDEPILGWLTSDMVRFAHEPLDLSAFRQPRLEPEIALVLGEDLEGPAVSATDVLAATAGVCVAIEVLDSRYADFSFTHVDVVADNASAAAYLLSETVRPAGGLDLGLCGVCLYKNGELTATSAGAATLGHPAAATAWAVRELHRRRRGLRAGQIVLSGALTGAVAVAPGDWVRAEVDSLGELQVTCA